LSLVGKGIAGGGGEHERMFDDSAGILTELVDDERLDAQRAAVKLGRIARFVALNPDEAGKLSTKQLNHRLRRAVARADPEAAARRAAAKSAARRVMRTNLGDGEASLTFQGDVERIQIAHDRIRAPRSKSRLRVTVAPWTRSPSTSD
jgi:hypothetical protein